MAHYRSAQRARSCRHRRQWPSPPQRLLRAAAPRRGAWDRHIAGCSKGRDVTADDQRVGCRRGRRRSDARQGAGGPGGGGGTVPTAASSAATRASSAFNSVLVTSPGGPAGPVGPIAPGGQWDRSHRERPRRRQRRGRPWRPPGLESPECAGVSANAGGFVTHDPVTPTIRTIFVRFPMQACNWFSSLLPPRACARRGNADSKSTTPTVASLMCDTSSIVERQ